jgi:hypothetical protein
MGPERSSERHLRQGVGRRYFLGKAFRSHSSTASEGARIRRVNAEFRYLAAFLIAICVSTANAQQSVGVQVESTASKQQEVVELTHGMSRASVLQQLGPPDFESLIGSLDRSRVNYDDELELLFEKGQLIAAKASSESRTTDGRYGVKQEGAFVVFGDDLNLADMDPLPQGEQRRAIDDHFYWKESIAGDDGLSTHFTPTMSQCLLDNCPGCDTCQGAGLGCAGCGSSCCDGMGSGSCRAVASWTLLLSVDALFLSRDASEFQMRLFDGVNSVQTESVGHGLTPGIRASGIVNLTGRTFTEFTYIGAHQWDATGSSTDLLTGSDDLLSSTQTFEATLNDYQVNVVHRRPGQSWGLLWGFRYSEHEDDYSLSLDGQFAGPPTTPRNPLNLTGTARNRLMGLQLGADHVWNCGALQLFGRFKAGALHNETEQTGASYPSVVSLDGNPSSIPRFTSDGEEVSFVGDVECSIRYAMTQSASIRFGYQGLAFSDLVTSASQNGNAADAESIYYHGIFAGLEIRR